MRLINQAKILFFSLLIFIYVAAFWMQSHILLRSDVSALLHETIKLLAGGRYGKDFFEPNPPMIFYLYIPPVLLFKYGMMNLVLALQVYVFLLATLSLYLCYRLVKNIFLPENSLIMAFWLLMLAVVYLILPFGDFGQREHLLVMLTMPYFLLVVYRLTAKSNQQTIFFIMVGVLAAAGFLVKPHYLLPFLLVEGYYIFCKKNGLAWIRAETMVILFLLIGYVGSIFIFYPEYLQVIVPHVARFYYVGLGTPLSDLIFNSIVIFCCFSFLLKVFFKKNNTQEIFSTLLLIAMTGFLLGYFIQDTEWYYHIYPVYSLAILLDVFLLSILVTQTPIDRGVFLRASIFAVLFLVFLSSAKIEVNWTVIVFFPGTFFAFFGVVFSILFYFANMKKIQIIFTTGFILSLGFAFSYMAQHTPWHAHRFFLTLLLMFMLFILFFPKEYAKATHALLFALLAVFVFSFPVYASFSMYGGGMANKDQSQLLIRFLKAHAENKSILFFSSNIQGYPLIDYVKNVSYASRYSFYVWLPGLVLHPEKMSAADKDYYLAGVAAELNIYQPDFVFVDIKKYKPNLGVVPFEFIPFFSQDKNFLLAWKSYHYLTTIESLPLFKFEVYERGKPIA